MREAFRQQQVALRESVDVVLVARPSMAGKSLMTVVRDLRRGLSGLWIEDGVVGGV
jgi:RNase P protein component